jgi:hypothetical protein
MALSAGRGSLFREPKPGGETTMRFMLLVKADKDSEAGVLPNRELIAAMG